METALIAAAVAAIVSALSQGVQLWIARRSRISTESAPTRQLLSDERRHQLATVRQLQVETEKMRVHIWTLLGQTLRTRLEKSDVEDLVSTVEALRVAASGFAGNWAQIKFDVPRGVQGRMRRIWHDMRPPLQILDALKSDAGRVLARSTDSEAAAEKQSLRATLRAVEEPMKQVQGQLREFSELLTVAKAYLLGELSDA